jgi:hypothetical protein
MRKVQQQLPRPCSRRALLRPWPPPPAPLALPAALAPRSKERPGSRFRRICLSSEVNRRKMVDPLGRVSSWKTTKRRAFRSWFSFVRLRRVCAWKRGVWSLEDCVGRTSATCNDQRERMPWREFRVGGMGVCLGVSEARAWVHVAHAVEYRIFILCASPLPFPAPSSPYGGGGTPVPASVALPRLVGRRAGSSGAVGVGARASLFHLEGTVRTLRRALARNLSSGHRCLLARTDDPMPLSLVLGKF